MQKKLYLICIGCCLSMLANAENRFIIKYKPTESQSKQLAAGGIQAKIARVSMASPLSKAQINTLSHIQNNASVTEINQIATGAHVIITSKNLNQEQTDSFIKQVKQQQDVEYIEVDQLLQPVSNASGPISQANPSWQWDMNSTGEFAAHPNWTGDDFNDAWSTLNNAGYGVGTNVVVAVVDTGYTPHPNILGALLPISSNMYGYQFISDCRISGTCVPSTPSSTASNSEYVPDALDLGDYVSNDDINNSNGFFNTSCARDKSTWHGSHVTGIIAASGYSTANPSYMTGGAYGAKIVPVRVLGKCGGYVSDIVNGVMWASGLDVWHNGVRIASNPNPAQVINLSLGGSGMCNSTEQDAINAVNNNGSIIVVAAGNNNGNIINYNPAGCSGIIVVAARGPTNFLAYYSNYGATTITASGGDRSVYSCTTGIDGSIICPSTVYSTVWSSPNTFQSIANGGAPSFAFYSGTSMATPHVTAAVADIIGVLKAKSEHYTLYGITAVLQQTADAYNNCNIYGCAGTADLNTNAAVNYAIQNPALPEAPQTVPLVSGGGGGGGGGGGCSAISDGDDYSLVLLLIGSAFYAIRRKKILKTDNSERMVK